MRCWERCCGGRSPWCHRGCSFPHGVGDGDLGQPVHDQRGRFRSGQGHRQRRGTRGRCVSQPDDTVLEDPPSPGIGSGEGLARLFKGYGDNADGATDRVHLEVNEVGTLEGLADRKGGTLVGELLKGFMGQALGFSNAQRATTTYIHAQTYRLCLGVGAQPENAGFFLDRENRHVQRTRQGAQGLDRRRAIRHHAHHAAPGTAGSGQPRRHTRHREGRDPDRADRRHRRHSSPPGVGGVEIGDRTHDTMGCAGRDRCHRSAPPASITWSRTGSPRPMEVKQVRHGIGIRQVAFDPEDDELVALASG